MDSREIIKDSGIKDIKDSQSSVLDKSTNYNLVKAILLKTERLASAVYLVTGLMDSTEVIKAELRTVSLAIINDLYFLNEKSGNQTFVSDNVLKKIEHIVSLLEVSLTGGIISNMNHSILKDEYLKLKDALTKFKLTEGVSSFLIPSQFFGEELTNLKEVSDPASSIKDTNMMSLSASRKTPEMNTKVTSVPKSIKDITTTKNKINNKILRQDLITRVVKDNTGYTIKDIINEVSIIDSSVDCSNKTIQRDLIELVSAGVLNKVGERRWSRYFKKL